jgi:hypothetical protein
MGGGRVIGIRWGHGGEAASAGAAAWASMGERGNLVNLRE